MVPHRLMSSFHLVNVSFGDEKIRRLEGIFSCSPTPQLYVHRTTGILYFSFKLATFNDRKADVIQHFAL